MTPERFIETIRNSFNGSVEVYTKGSCYQFYLILKEVFPQAIAYHNYIHVITEINGRYYDINGEVEKEKYHILLSDEMKEQYDSVFDIYKKTFTKQVTN